MYATIDSMVSIDYLGKFYKENEAGKRLCKQFSKKFKENSFILFYVHFIALIQSICFISFDQSASMESNTIAVKMIYAVTQSTKFKRIQQQMIIFFALDNITEINVIRIN